MSTEEINRQINDALRGRPRSYTPPATMSETRQRFNDRLRREAKRGVIEVSAETGEIVARDGRPVKQQGKK